MDLDILFTNAVVIDGSGNERQQADVGLFGERIAAVDILAGNGIFARVIEIHTIKPLDEQLVIQAAEETGLIVTAEEHTIIGGLGGAIAETLVKHHPAPIEQVGIQDEFARTGLSPETLMDSLGLGVKDIVAASRRALARKSG